MTTSRAAAAADADADDRMIAGGLAGCASLRRPACTTQSWRPWLAENDEYVRVDGPIGPLFVAYGKRGISLVERVDAVGDAGDFEEAVPRNVRPAGAPRGARARADPEDHRRAAVGTCAEPLADALRARSAARLRAPGAAQGARRSRAARCGRTHGSRQSWAGRWPCARSAMPWHATRSRSSSRAIAWSARTAGSATTAPAGRSPSAPCWRRRASTSTSSSGCPTRGVRFIGSDTTHIFCYPSCRNAKRVTDAHRVPLRSSDEARTPAIVRARCAARSIRRFAPPSRNRAVRAAGDVVGRVPCLPTR